MLRVPTGTNGRIRGLGAHLMFPRVLLALLIACITVTGQATGQSSPSVAASIALQSSSNDAARKPEAPAALRIAEGDEIEISVFNVPELAVHDQVDDKGKITLPLAGAVHVAGLTSDEAGAAVAKALSDGGFVNQPQVSVHVKNYGNATIAVLGEVAKPGVYPASDRPRVMQLIQLAGGLTDKAGATATIAHAGQANSPATINLPSDADTVAKANVELQPGDTVVVSRAGMIYVLGEVNQAGAYAMAAGKDISVLQAIVMAKGPGGGASPNKTRILRRTPTGLVEIPVKLKEIMQARTADLTLQPEDILFVPSGRKTLNSGSLFGTLTSLVVYRVPF